MTNLMRYVIQRFLGREAVAERRNDAIAARVASDPARCGCGHPRAFCGQSRERCPARSGDPREEQFA